jgi:peptide deformylase
MAVRRIRQLGDPILTLCSEPLGTHSKAERALKDLRDTLHWFRETHGFGRGISAVQIGLLERVIYIEFEGATYCMIDPEYIHQSEEKFVLWDDCFSFPALMVKLERAVRVHVRYMNENGELKEIAASGPLSELLQHEMDHLDGILAVHRAMDRDSFMTREEWLRQQRESGAEMSPDPDAGLGARAV